MQHHVISTTERVAASRGKLLATRTASDDAHTPPLRAHPDETMAQVSLADRIKLAASLGAEGGPADVGVLKHQLEKDASSLLRAASAEALGRLCAREPTAATAAVHHALLHASDMDADEAVRAAAFAARALLAAATADTSAWEANGSDAASGSGSGGAGASPPPSQPPAGGAADKSGKTRQLPKTLSRAPPPGLAPAAAPPNAAWSGGGGGGGASVSSAKRAKTDVAQLAADAADVPLCNALQTARVRLADGKPAYIVFDNKTLTAISKARPATAAQLRAVPGIGADKVRKYGDDILRCVEENPRPGGGSAAAEAAAAAAAAEAAEAAAQPAVALNSEQSRALDLALRGESLFLTGGAGTGKSFTLNHIVKALKQQRGEGQVFVTASTGIAACHIGGTTLHSFAGVGLARESASDLASRVMGNRTSMRRWTGASVLVIDEVSMLDGTFFDKLEEIARIVRDAPDDEPFGGL